MSRIRSSKKEDRMRNWSLVREQISLVLASRKERVTARKELGIPKPTWNRWIAWAIKYGVDCLRDHRHGNNHKVTVKQHSEMRRLKKEGPWRSARAIKDRLNLSITEQTVSRHIADLMHLNVERLKPLQRFVADRPNDLWQTDIMGRMNFPKLGIAYLIAELDDCSRFILSSGWYRKQNKLNVFSIFYAGLAHWGRPKASL
jgi:hypothetical protein